ncbi:cell division control protein 6 homolog [Ochlerotatus camptorhynchus]|uniref:cell division control protein 6 homolog n=1 Tax=Ochlerotatus camptorhynchus TaxID=644619 RepID=UPI0031D4AAF8
MSYRTRGQSSKVTALSDESKENTTPKRRGRPKKNNDIPEASPPKRAKATNGRRQVTTNDAEEISVSAIGCLPERERETEDLAKYIEDILSENGSGSLYISGPPGTGKTATLTRIISDQKLASKLNMVYVNCTSISTAGGIYKKICEGLKLSVGGTTEKFYLVAIEEYLKKKHKTVMLVLDEIDQLASSKQTVLYNIFEWPTKRESKLILVGIANALDLTDRLLSRLQARCELKPHLIQFLPYTKQQLVNILKTSLQQKQKADMFNDAALQMLAAKVASTSGDARRALLLTRTLVESTDNEYRQEKKSKNTRELTSPPKAVHIRSVVSTLNQVYGTIQTMTDEEAFPLQQKLLVCALLLVLKASKSKDITVGKLHQVYKAVCSKRNLLSVDQAEFGNLCSLVETRGILRMQGKKEPRLTRILLQWDEEEVHNALNDKQLIASVLSDTSCVIK